MKTIYFDHIAGNPLDPRVKEAMLPYLTDIFGNPQSMHSFGEQTREAIDEARAQVAQLINASSEELFFTASGTESNNFALKGLALANQSKGKHIVVSAIEHQSILHSAKFLEKLGFKISHVGVDKYGIVSRDELARQLTDETTLVSIMLANSEVGTIEPIAGLTGLVKEKGILFHCDAVAAVGNIPVDVNELRIDALSMAANQFYGPSGAAALYVRKGVRILPLLDGGIQEEGRRAGTENVPVIVGMGKAARLAWEEMPKRSEYLRSLRDSLIKELTNKIDYLYFTGHPENRLPHHASFCVEFIEGEAMLLSLSMEGMAVSSGSACTSRALKASHVLKAIGVGDALAQGSIVFSLGMSNAKKDIEYLTGAFPAIIDRLRKMSPLYTKHIQKKGDK
ncbi:MAG: cysteine desulfurase [Deltaproteobacteria bacterium]|nr:MAG: cysteine desulfurase [Deltaproteobacteria bacterium]